MTLPSNIKFSIFRDYMHGSVAIIAYTPHGYLVPDGNGNVVHTEIADGEEGKPFMTISSRGTETLQSLADALAEFGVMPKTGDNGRELSAIRAHLADMQRMANRAFDMLTAMPRVVTDTPAPVTSARVG